jgi:hypothetical protein
MAALKKYPGSESHNTSECGWEGPLVILPGLGNRGGGQSHGTQALARLAATMQVSVEVANLSMRIGKKLYEWVSEC